MRRHEVKERLASKTHIQSSSLIFKRAADIGIRGVMEIHAVISIIVGLSSFLIPHGFYSLKGGGYNHMAHEFVRLYGCLTLAIGYLVWRTRDIKDSRLLKSISEAFALCYILQSLAMLRAQFTNPNGHSIFHWLIAVIFLIVGLLYAFVRFIKKIKGIELPGLGLSDD